MALTNETSKVNTWNRFPTFERALQCASSRKDRLGGRHAVSVQQICGGKHYTVSSVK